MNILKDILYKVPIKSVKGSTALEVNNLHFDSRSVTHQDAFVAIRGTAADGHLFIDAAISKGAQVVVCEDLPSELAPGITYVQVKDTREALAIMASNYYGNPSSNLKLVGVTGTNGKTTVTSLLYQLFKALGFKVGLISTVTIKVDDKEFSTKLTTPDSLKINSYLQMMNEVGVEFCFMEVSSHGIAQHRTLGLDFKGGIFTNLSQDHLDYHNSFAEYRDVKKRFFDQLSKDAFAITNIDDKNGNYMLQNTKAKTYGYGVKNLTDYKVKILEKSFSGLKLTINGNEVWSRFIGDFNAYNLLAVYAAADLLGVDELENLQTLSQLKPVDGRYQHHVSTTGIHVIVDYAHTPDALKNVLQTTNDIRTRNEDLITVVGCGGDRDKTKRPVMGKIAGNLSTKVIFTSDNPRTEDPEEIISDIEKGVESQDVFKTLSITSRQQAIKTACSLAHKGDIILIAGKGHETYQEVHGVRSDFDDLKIVKELLAQFNK
ncbi:UDP-N-acetylmuramoyl-L-alanyl-D-glutamate--2,6-diaminopimelate ligase [Psychroflexus sp. CAK57W]|uniref:UDP-N-acetylmuramoyl-L-alanyl-D-glutamate--2, 6-diaminopimelate ligase n=1 Tax=Psychroflexus curvus TaxID=2873595 RepID=UPI001CCCF41B|nr:UDP-N-acetylmuramoyl-L-alanyl-D-glutamate--2,6-diaminopimelate ligase [Psychroflexus curvus]MBZ9627951.1 UDP-N-acetylmuramoyl-L-alanyl-D-glutamate--2,6-diaminopimelate ligase [Psychroflexus curvus]MBZ9787649.1 UDP-N-acetylmuramoyl-L-alanyl-D-glutamate--2,6-diaminopimelate ligase [Psychroflexus curvus]